MTLLSLLMALLLPEILLALVVFNLVFARRITTALPPAGRFIEIDGARLHYIDRGQGPPMLMLHGIGGQAHDFSQRLMARLTPRHRVILLDRPGSGHSTRPRQMSADLTTQSALVAKFIHALDLGRPLLVGHGFGGAVALAVALDHADSVGALALIAPLSHPPAAPPTAMRAAVFRTPLQRWLIAWTLAVPVMLRQRQHMLRSAFSPDRPPRDFAAAGGDLLALRPAAFYAASADLQAAMAGLPALARRYAALRTPLHILCGRQDAVLDWQAQGQALAQATPAAQLTVITGGHMLLVSVPDDAAAWLLAAAAAHADPVG